MSANDLIVLACQHLNSAQMFSSARLCIDDAISLAGRDETTLAKRRALKSLGYSIGICHPDMPAECLD